MYFRNTKIIMNRSDLCVHNHPQNAELAFIGDFQFPKGFSGSNKNQPGVPAMFNRFVIDWSLRVGPVIESIGQLMYVAWRPACPTPEACKRELVNMAGQEGVLTMDVL